MRMLVKVERAMSRFSENRPFTIASRVALQRKVVICLGYQITVNAKNIRPYVAPW